MFLLFKKLTPFFLEHKKRYGWAIFAMLIGNGLVLIPPFIVGQVIDGIYLDKLTDSLLMKQVLLFVFSIVVSYGIEIFWGYQLFGGKNVLTRQLRKQLMNHFLKMRSIFYRKFRTGDLMARATNDLDAISEMAGYGIMIAMDSTAFFGVILLTMFLTVSWKLTLACILPLPILGYLLKVLGDKVHIRYKESQDAFAEINDEVLESVEGIRVIRAYGRQEAMSAQFDEKTTNVLQKNISVAKINSAFQPLIKITLGISYVLAFGLGAIMVSKNEITIGQLVAFQVYLSMLVWPIQSIGELINLLQQGNASMDRVMEVLNTDDQMGHTGEKDILENGTITFKEVTFSYPDSKQLSLKKINLEIPKNTTLGIVGKTGSGKTTLVRQLLKEYPRGKGLISIGGVPIDAVKPDQLSSKFGYVPQEHILFSGTIRDNISFGRKDASEKEINEALHLANFDRDINKMPNGLDTQIGEKGISLSGGQKQRIAIARALIKNSAILILDDSLSAVDAETEKNIITNLKKYRNNKTTLIITHRLSSVYHAKQIIVMDNGAIIERGTHTELMDKKGWYEKQFIRQQLKEEE
ncbi:ATP-binding cassette, subfamily B [Carnobacterium iners]|uniref:ATP-binding cassette, subfamily B n=1 Tax=Carnobacterium iners TaxID=1073423 RepID=A0A1X7NIV1_9LACT|nr:ABC transporter ATP-binding protein [Carnobacterium iners]SEK66682.1 ATP-binding cassette, subfamily B [Carnobacterium iners]SMH37763.1 ATP-binding cassette, subfamily B [Carnobacterium iners]